MKTACPAQQSDTEPPNTLLVKISPHLKRLIKTSPALKQEFVPSSQEINPSCKAFDDPLLEDRFLKTKGLVHKYPGRVLIELTMQCASYCRFCTRRRIVSDIEKGRITAKDLNNMLVYLKSHPEINEVIASGGDPFMAPVLLEQFIRKVKHIPSIKIIRVHTRVPVSNPKLVPESLYNAFSKITKQALYISVHFEHPDEFTKPTLNVIRKLKQTGAILLSQSVFLKGVNDNYETLYTLFTRLSQLGVRPYYIYRCDPVNGIEHFIVPFKKEIEIMTKLRKYLSGIACPTYVIDTPNGSGKIPVALDFWQFDKSSFIDFDGKKIEVFENVLK